MRATAKQVGALWFDSFPSAAVRFRVCHSQKGYKNEDRRYTTQQHDSVALWNEAGAWQNLRLFKGGDKKIHWRCCHNPREQSARQGSARVCPQLSQWAIFHPQTITNPTKEKEAMKPQHLNTVVMIRKRLAKHLKFFPTLEALETSYQWIINAPQEQWADRTFAAIQAARGKKDPSAVYAWTFQGSTHAGE